MASPPASASIGELPVLPEKMEDFISYVKSQPSTSMVNIMEPYRRYDSVLRQIFAQSPDHAALADPLVNVVPIYDGHETDVKIRARNPDAEPEAVRGCYLMPLHQEARLSTGVAAITPTLKEFQTRFNVFSELSLAELDWSNVVVAGSAVVTALLPVPEKYASSKRGLREYYHQKIAPASDVDLFLYGLSEEQAIEKIKQIEKSIQDAILHETTTVRTKNAITIASRHPTRHVQIVLRIYKSVSEILTGFDVDSSCLAYDGKQVYACPRAIASYMTQINHIDLTRRSPSYETRLSKYAQRGFEVYWEKLDRSRIDPTIFDRSYKRTIGLAKLLVLERLPRATDREDASDEKRMQRGRPPPNRYMRYRDNSRGDMKAEHDYDVADWVEEDEVSNYHTVTIPYGPRFHARKIEKLLFAKDLLLNAEFNRPRDRDFDLHRHPAFFGDAEDVMKDCCGFCPSPTEDIEDIAEEESKHFISGPVTFIKDDPGRQAIGSFNPLTDDDWTDMAYVGNTARLCQAINEGDLNHVNGWLAQDGADPNCRDYTGRTPLHLAIQCSTTEIVQALVDGGARLVARLADGRTALHIAAGRGRDDVVRLLLQKSEENMDAEAAEAEAANAEAYGAATSEMSVDEKGEDDDWEDEDEGGEGDEDDEEHNEDGNSAGADESMAEGEEPSEEDDSIEDLDMDDLDLGATTEGSYVNVHSEKPADDANEPEDDDDEPDIIDLNAVAWDVPYSPLHLAIFGGHLTVVETLVGHFGANVLLPIRLVNSNRAPEGSILTLLLALYAPSDKVTGMIQLLLRLGASSAQADFNAVTALQFFAARSVEALCVLLEHDRPAAERAIQHLTISARYWYREFCSNALKDAIVSHNSAAAMKLLEAGAEVDISFDHFTKELSKSKLGKKARTPKDRQDWYEKATQHPIVYAIANSQMLVAAEIMSHGVDPNTLTMAQGWNLPKQSLLDHVRRHLEALIQNLKKDNRPDAPLPLHDLESYLGDAAPDSYRHWVIKTSVLTGQSRYERDIKQHEEKLQKLKCQSGAAQKKKAVKEAVARLKDLEQQLLTAGAKSTDELLPDQEKRAAPRSSKLEKTKRKAFEVNFSFTASELTDKMKEGYMRLFEAAWDGDFPVIASLTTALWGPNKNRTPLKIAVRDQIGNSPLSIAVLRGHTAIVKGMLDIALGQYKPEAEEGRKRYALASDYSYEDSEDAGSDATSEINFRSDVVDEDFTMENVGEEITEVESAVTPVRFLTAEVNVIRYLHGDSVARWEPYSSDIIRWVTMDERVIWPNIPERLLEVLPPIEKAKNLLQYAMFKDDMTLFTQLLDLEDEYRAKTPEGERYKTETAKIAGLGGDLSYAIELGRTKMIAELIRRKGAGVDLDQLAEQSGLRLNQKTEYYKGLTIRGKRREDWASAARDVEVQDKLLTRSLLLEAAYQGSLESVNFFLSDEPLKCYEAFAAKHQDDERMQQLDEKAGGFKKIVKSWLDSKHELIAHAVVSGGRKGDDRVALLKHVLKAVPKSLNTLDVSDYTPLHYAFSRRDAALARLLLDAGADATLAKPAQENVIYAMFCPGDSCGLVTPDGISDMLSLLPEATVTSLMTERHPTPLEMWITQCTSTVHSGRFCSLAEEESRRTVLSQYKYGWRSSTPPLISPSSIASRKAVLKELLAAPGGMAALEGFSINGDTALHRAVAQSCPWLVEALIEHGGSRLARMENGVGRTAAEVAVEKVESRVMRAKPAVQPRNRPWAHSQSIADIPENEFVEGGQGGGDLVSNEDDSDDSKAHGKEGLRHPSEKEVEDQLADMLRPYVLCAPGERRLADLSQARMGMPEAARERERKEREAKEKEKAMKDTFDDWYENLTDGAFTVGLEDWEDEWITFWAVRDPWE